MPRSAIQPEAEASAKSPKRRAQGVAAAEGVAMTSAPGWVFSLTSPAARMVGGKG
jgi:hypothetical protein